jgi:chromosome segregation ATPase
VSQTPAKPAAEDFSGGAVQRGVLKDTLQHPLTILPAAVSAVSLMYMGLISFDPRSFGIGFGAALFGAAAWVVNYFFRGEQFAGARIRRLRAAREAQREAAAAALRAACEAERFPRGVDAAGDLAAAYAKLQGLLAQQAEAGKASAVRFAVLADDTYREGMQLLHAALDTHRALRGIDADKLRGELSAWQTELRSLDQRARPEAASGRREALETRIAGHERRLASYEDRHTALQRLLAQCEALESALETAYLEVLDLGHEKDQLFQGQAASRLERAVAAARLVENRLRNAEDHSTADAVYLQHGGGSARTRT